MRIHKLQLTTAEGPRERMIMKTIACIKILAVIVVMMFSAVGALAQTEMQQGAQKPM
jgi:hypothetical protein